MNKLTKEEKQELSFQEQQIRFEGFTNELEKLSKRYGVSLDITGGVYVMSSEDKQKIKEIIYSNDSSSGDLSSKIIFKNEK